MKRLSLCICFLRVVPIGDRGERTWRRLLK
uniref:Uncharacterized protein n=1 Tax=Anguilla anguilla TaxID=7936 RepID=A0A0E9T325_ANGAN